MRRTSVPTWISVFSVIAVAALCASCGSGTETSPPATDTNSKPAQKAVTAPLAEVVADHFEIKGELQGNELTFWLETDLPDTVAIMAHVHREYVGKNQEGIETYVPPYWSENLTVGSARQPRTVTIDDAKWAQDVERNLKLMAIGDDPMTILSVNQAVTVSMTVPGIGHGAAADAKWKQSHGESRCCGRRVASRRERGIVRNEAVSSLEDRFGLGESSETGGRAALSALRKSECAPGILLCRSSC